MCILNLSISFHFNIYAGYFRQIVSLDFKPGMHLKKLLVLYLTNSHLKTWDWCSDFCNHYEINRHLTGCHISKYFEIFNSKSHWFKALHNLTMRRFFIVSTGLSGSSPIFLHIFMLIRYSHEKKKLATVTAHRELTVNSPWAHSELTVSWRWQKWSQPAVTEPWPGPWLSCDLAVTEPWSYWGCCDWAVTLRWLSCDLAVTELWPRRDWAVTSPTTEPWSLGPEPWPPWSQWAHGELTAHRELTVTIFFSWADISKPISTSDLCSGLYEIGPWALV